ncbi:MAG: DUF2306 domain-containing protein [Alphaproteobacteria bacterium]
MDFNILSAAQPPIPLHAYAACAAVILGAVQLVSKKGTVIHKYLGYGWVGLMLLVSLSSFWIHSLNIIGPFSPIHILSVVTIWTLYEAIKAARNKDIKKHKRFMILLYVFALLVAGAFTFLPGRIMYQVVFG